MRQSPTAKAAAAVRCLVVPLGQATLLVPGALVAEVTHSEPSVAVQGAPAWVLGLMPWRGLSVPLVSGDALLGGAGHAAIGRVVVFNTLGGSSKLPFLAMPSSGIPRLLRVEPQQAAADGGAETGNDSFVLRKVKIADAEYIIPDFDVLEQMLLGLDL
jgi:chemosensory pili system protein ChpC